MTTKDLHLPNAAPPTGSVTTFGVFACFERCKLSVHIADSSQFTENGLNWVAIWELVDVAWLTKVRSIIEKSVDNPKSYTKFVSVLDCWRRATAGYLSFRESGLKSHQELPEWMSEADAEEILRTERRANESRQIAKFGYPADTGRFWFADADEWSESDPFTLGRGVRGVGGPSGLGGESDVEEIADPIPAVGSLPPLPEVGSTVELKKPVRSFGGFVSAGAAQVASAGRDDAGRAIVELSRHGRVVVSGLGWPIRN